MTEQELDEFGKAFFKPDKEDIGRYRPASYYFEEFKNGGPTDPIVATTDPVAKWGLKHLIRHREIRQIILLLDWLPHAQIGQEKDTVTSAMQYCQDCWDKDPSVKYDSTLSLLMWAPWSRDLLLAGHCLPINTLWGIRKSEDLDYEHLIITTTKKIIRPIITSTNAKEIYACHEQLRWLYTHQIPNVSYLYHPSNVIEWMTKKPVPTAILNQWKSTLK